MTKIPEQNNEDYQKELDSIIDRTKAQNRVLKKLIEEINSGKPELKKINK